MKRVKKKPVRHIEVDNTNTDLILNLVSRGYFDNANRLIREGISLISLKIREREADRCDVEIGPCACGAWHRSNK